MPFDRIFLDELSARNDIVDIVSQYVQLKKSGAPPVTATGCMRCARTLRGFITKRCGSRKTAPRSSISSDAACRAAP